MVDRTNLVIDQNGSTTEPVNFGTADSLRFAPNDDSLIVIHQSQVQINDNDATAFRIAWTSTTPESQTTGGSPEHLVHPPVSWGNVGTQTRLNSLLPTPQQVQTTNISTTPRYVAIHPIASSRLYEEERLYDDESSWTEWVRPILAAACFFVAAILLARSLPFSPWYAQRSATAAVPTSQPAIKTIAIQDIDVGMRTMGQNPDLSQVETYPDPDPATSRKLVLRMTKESGGNLSVKLLRPLAWIEANSVVEGGTFFLDLPEMGAVGEAHVEAILPCPPIRPGPGNVVTGTFAHEAAAGQPILSVTFANGAHIHGVTDNHPTYSVTRQEFLPIGDMREGETVQLAHGTTTITHLTSRPARAGEMLYNLETHNEHVYQVTAAGVLVHNTCADDFVRMGRSRQLANDLANNRVFRLNSDELAFVSRIRDSRPNLQIFRTNQKSSLGDFLLIDRSNPRSPIGYLIDLKKGGGGIGDQFANAAAARQVFGLSHLEQLSGNADDILRGILGRGTFPQ